MQSINYLHEAIYVRRTNRKGRGVFTKQNIDAGVIVEVAPVIVMSNAERSLLDQTLLHDYIFEWGMNKNECCMALGCVPLYNHSYHSNCEYEMDFKRQVIKKKLSGK